MVVDLRSHAFQFALHLLTQLFLQRLVLRIVGQVAQAIGVLYQVV